MSAMEIAHPKIESTADALRIEFPAVEPRTANMVVILLCPVLWYLLVKLFGGPQLRDLGSLFGVLPFWLRMIWETFRRRSILLSEKGLGVRQAAFGIRWTKFYPLAEIQNLHFSYNPFLTRPPKQWELMFDRYGFAHSVPIPMTLPVAENVKAAIYSRFPQLAPQTQP